MRVAIIVGRRVWCLEQYEYNGVCAPKNVGVWDPGLGVREVGPWMVAKIVGRRVLCTTNYEYNGVCA